ncbi:MAG: hypothetical protein HFG60_09765, partial [Lachnospiraceae bacterium]|nr:hypothetical protein [Lachnospiraceae bacterium]
MAIQGGIELLVTPERLNQKAGEVEKHVANMRQRFAAMNVLVQKSKGYWIGDAGNMHRQNYSEQHHRVIVIDNEEAVVQNVPVITVEDDGSIGNVRK